MRIRKRTLARAAGPGQAPASPSPSPPPPPPPPPPPEQPKVLVQESSREENEAEEKKVILIEAGDQDEHGITAAKNSATDDVSKPEPEPQEDDNAGRCSRTDGKRWRCKSAAVPGYLFCDRHISWSTRKRKPRPNSKKKKNQGSSVLEEPTITKEPADEEEEEVGHEAKDEAARTPQLGRGGAGAGDDGFYYYGGFRPGIRKRARDSAPGPSA